MRKSVWIPLAVIGGAGLAASVGTSIYFATRKTSYTIKLDLDGGKIDGIKDSIKVAKGSTIGSLPTPKKDGLVFKAWINSKDQKELEPKSVIKSDMSLIATYETAPQPEPTHYIFLSGQDTIYSKTSDNEYTIEASQGLTDISWSISGWSGQLEDTPEFDSEGSTTRNIITHAAGTFKLTVSSTIAGVSDSLDITIQDPTVNSNKIWFSQDIEGVDTWCQITGWNATNINYKTLNGNDSSITLGDFNAELFFGEHVEVIDDSFLMNCTLFNSPIHFDEELRVIEDNFLYGATLFNQQLPEPEDLPNLISIGHNCLYGCTNFNNGNNDDTIHPLTLNPCTIGNKFMFDCVNFDNSVIIGLSGDENKIESIGDDFMYNCKAMTSRETNPSSIYINCPVDVFSYATIDPLTFAAFDNECAWAANGLPVHFTSETEKTDFMTNFKNTSAPFFRNIAASW